jgi:hypothetical protein
MFLLMCSSCRRSGGVLEEEEGDRVLEEEEGDQFFFGDELVWGRKKEIGFWSVQSLEGGTDIAWSSFLFPSF